MLELRGGKSGADLRKKAAGIARDLKVILLPACVIYSPVALYKWFLAVFNHQTKHHENVLSSDSCEELEVWLDLQGVSEECVRSGTEWLV